jgi:hypothetical protein
LHSQTDISVGGLHRRKAGVLHPQKVDDRKKTRDRLPAPHGLE